MYSQADFERNSAQIRKEMIRAALFALPFFAGAVAAFIYRVEPVCSACVLIAGAILIFLWDMRIGPLMRYKRYLKEIHSGLSHKTVGTLMSVGADPVYQEGVDLYEVIINIYEDMTEDGERRFLMDCEKSLPGEWKGRDIVVTSHGSYLLDARLNEA